MKNSVSDFVASNMDAILQSKEHKALFNKLASVMCAKCNKEDCKCDAAAADAEVEDTSNADDVVDSDDSSADDSLSTEAQLSVAIDSLLVASSALDAVGFEKSAELSLKIAAFVSEAKKAKNDKKLDALKKKKEEDKAKEKAKKDKDVQMAKDKKVKEKAKLEAEKAKAKAKAEAEKAKELAAKEKAKKSGK